MLTRVASVSAAVTTGLSFLVLERPYPSPQPGTARHAAHPGQSGHVRIWRTTPPTLSIAQADFRAQSAGAPASQGRWGLLGRLQEVADHVALDLVPRDRPPGVPV